MNADNKIRVGAIAPGPGGVHCPCCRQDHASRGCNGRRRAARVNAMARRLARHRAESWAHRDLSKNPY